MKKQSLSQIISIAALGTIVLICSNGLTFTGLTVFDKSLIDTFGWTKSTVKFRDLINLCTAALLMPFVGAAIDRYGVKKSLALGLILLSLCFYLYSMIGTPTHMYAIHLILALAVSAAGTLTVIIMVSERVERLRGLAIGIALAGTSLGGIIMTKLAGYMIDAYGWRMAFKYEAIIPIGLLIIVMAFLRPKSSGNQDDSKTRDLEEIPFATALKNKTFWFLALIGFFSYYAILGIMGNLYLFMLELEFDGETAINALSLISFIILGGKFLSGTLTDWFDKYNLFRIQIFIMFLGTVFFALYSTTWVWVAIPIIAIGWGGLYTLINYILITTFGVNSAGKIGGTISTFESIGAGLGIWLSGLIADMSGSYLMSFRVIAVLLFFAFILSLLIKPVSADANKES